MTTSAVPSYAGYRFPAEVISHAVWLYFRFPLSLRMVDELLATRGIIVSYETVRQWALKFVQVVCQPDPPQAACGWRQVAHGRCVTDTVPKLELWSCMRDEGRPLDAGSQGQASNHCKLRSSKAMVVSIAAKGET